MRTGQGEAMSEPPSDLERALEEIYREFLLREQLGEHPPPDEYLRRFPKGVHESTAREILGEK